MKFYTAHTPPYAAENKPDIVLVREGFTWGGFLFTGLWLLWHRVWFWGVLVLAFDIGGSIVAERWMPGSGVLVHGGVALLIGLLGSDLRRADLDRRGHLDRGIVAGPDAESALLRFLDRKSDITL